MCLTMLTIRVQMGFGATNKGDCMSRRGWGFRFAIKLGVSTRSFRCQPRWCQTFALVDPNSTLLFATCGNRVFMRKVKVKGACSFQPPINRHHHVSNS